jgi:hypothetical protein
MNKPISITHAVANYTEKDTPDTFDCYASKWEDVYIPRFEEDRRMYNYGNKYFAKGGRALTSDEVEAEVMERREGIFIHR